MFYISDLMNVVKEFVVIFKQYDAAQTMFKKAMDQNKRGNILYKHYFCCINKIIFSDFENAIEKFQQKLETRLNFSKIVEINEKGKNLFLIFYKN